MSAIDAQPEPTIRTGPTERVLGLDVMRALAILLVMVSHFTNNIAAWYGLHPPPSVFFSGDLGVDMFFALSGFLIGRILLALASQAPTWNSLRIFLIRRWLRTLPAYLTWLAVLLALFPPASHVLRRALMFASLTQNLVTPMPAGDYWFSVSWSLTIEEWFYLLFGTATIIAAMLVRRHWFIWVPLLPMLLIPVALRLPVPVSDYYNSGLFKMVPYRLDEIGYGVICAWLYARRSRVFDHPVFPALLGLCAVAEAWLEPIVLPFTAYAMLRNDLAVIGCALCIPAALQIRTAPTWFALPFRAASRLSYTLYLVHLNILVDVAQALFFRGAVSRSSAIIIAVLGTYATAELLSRLIEQPAMRLRPRQA